MWHQWLNCNFMKPREYYLCAKKKKNYYSTNSSLPCQSLWQYRTDIFVASENYGWTTDVTWTILMMSLLPFWTLNVVVMLLQGQKALGFHQTFLNLSSEDERRSFGFGTTWGWVINDRTFIFGWTIPLTFRVNSQLHFLNELICLHWYETIRCESHYLFKHYAACEIL